MRNLEIGLILKGSCGGRFNFSDESFADKRIEAIGNDWLVVRNLVNGNPEMVFGTYIKEELRPYIERE